MYVRDHARIQKKLHSMLYDRSLCEKNFHERTIHTVKQKKKFTFKFMNFMKGSAYAHIKAASKKLHKCEWNYFQMRNHTNSSKSNNNKTIDSIDAVDLNVRMGVRAELRTFQWAVLILFSGRSNHSYIHTCNWARFKRKFEKNRNSCKILYLIFYCEIAMHTRVHLCTTHLVYTLAIHNCLHINRNAIRCEHYYRINEEKLKINK